jgi:ribosomal protein L37E
MLRSYTLKRKKAGQTTCERCGKSHNNASIPNKCDCGYVLGGNFQPNVKDRRIPGDAKLIQNLVSVRLNPQGINVRTFVNLSENKVRYI